MSAGCPTSRFTRSGDFHPAAGAPVFPVVWKHLNRSQPCGVLPPRASLFR